MSVFRIGLRVRVIRSKSRPDIIGTETVITGHSVNGPGWWRIDVPVSHPMFRHVGIPQDNLEPIIPEGMQPVAWSECLWQPEGSGVTA